MTRIKICGLRRLDDVAAVNMVMPDFAGFVFAESRRKVTLDQAKELIQHLDKRIRPVGVFVDMSPAAVSNIAEQCGLAVVQLHGSEDAATISATRWLLPDVSVWKAIPVRKTLRDTDLDAWRADGFLLDTWHPDAAGGTGKTFQWQWVDRIRQPFILAGGLTPENVGQAIDTLSPYGVDVSSGVESDGIKDPLKIRRFVEAVRAADQNKSRKG